MAGTAAWRGPEGLTADGLRALEARTMPPATPGHDHLVWDRAEGATITTLDGRRVIDFTSGVLITNVGHAHPHVTAAIREQAGRGLNTFLAPHPLRATYAERLLERLGPGFERVAFLSSGAEAVDTAARIARIATGRQHLIAFTDGYHGKTTLPAALSGLASASPQGPERRDGVLIAPYPDPLRRPFVDGDLLEGMAARIHELAEGVDGDVAGIVAEPYLGSGGAVVPPDGFGAVLRRVADDLGAVLIADEVQAGFGRTGTLFAFEGDGFRPDLVVLAKGIASGVPMAVVAGPAALLDAPAPGTLWNSFGGGPLACAAAHATLDVLDDPALGARVRALGEDLVARVRSWGLGRIADCRGRGLSLGIDVVTHAGSLDPDPAAARALVVRAGEEGVMTLSPSGRGRNVVRIAPPLVITDEEYEAGMAALERAARVVLG